MIKTEKLSSWALYGSIAITIIVFLLFFTVGYDNPVGDYNEPQLTEGLLFLMYAFVLVTAGLTCWSVYNGIVSSVGGNGENLSGVPGGKVSIAALGMMIISLIVGYCTGIGEADFTAADGTVTTGAWVGVVDMFIISIYILSVIAILGVVINMTGIIKNSAVK